MKTYNSLGRENAALYLSRFGIEVDDENNNATLALGNTQNTDFVELTGSYAALANNGFYVEPVFVKEIYDKSGKLIYSHNPQGIQVVSAENAYIITDVLLETATDGTARGLSSLGISVAAKTGTVGNSDGNTDAYNLAYTTDHTFLVWHGNSTGDAEKNMDLSETGGAYVTRTMREILAEIYKESAPKSFEMPENVYEIIIDKYAQTSKQELLLATENTPAEYKKAELFADNNRPTVLSPYFESFSVENVSVRLGSGGAVIEFDKEDYLIYEVYRIANGKNKRIAKIDKKTEKPLIDRSFPYNSYVKYSIKPHFFDQYGNKVEGIAVETDTVYERFEYDYTDFD